MHYCGIDVAMKSRHLYITDGLGKVRRKGEFHRGKKTAIGALPRKLLTIAYHLLKQQTVYDAKKLRRAA